MGMRFFVSQIINIFVIRYIMGMCFFVSQPLLVDENNIRNPSQISYPLIQDGKNKLKI